MKIEMRGVHPSGAGTTSSMSRPVITDVDAYEREQPALRADTMRLERAYDRASASSYESAWEGFVAEAAQHASQYQASEIDWLLDRIRNGSSLPFRRALSLVRAAGAIAEVRRELSLRFAPAFAFALAHPVAEVRAAALEATSESDIAAAKQLAGGLVEDASPIVRETAKAILAMTE